MLTVLEELWLVVDFLSLVWDLLVNWRLVGCLAACLGVALVLRYSGAVVGEGSFVFATVLGLVLGLGWELLAAAHRRGYI